MTARTQRVSHGRDRGSISGFVVAMTLAVVACAGLAVDGGRMVGGKVAAADHAANAARAGAQELTALRTGAITIDPARARRTASAYLRAHGLSGSVDATSQRVTVTVRLRITTTLLHLVGIGSTSVSSTRSSSPITQ